MFDRHNFSGVTLTELRYAIVEYGESAVLNELRHMAQAEVDRKVAMAVHRNEEEARFARFARNILKMEE